MTEVSNKTIMKRIFTNYNKVGFSIMAFSTLES